MLFPERWVSTRSLGPASPAEENAGSLTALGMTFRKRGIITLSTGLRVMIWIATKDTKIQTGYPSVFREGENERIERGRPALGIPHFFSLARSPFRLNLNHTFHPCELV